MSTTIVNTPPSASAPSANGIGFLIGTLVLLLFGGLFYFYVLPSIRQMTSKGVQVNVPMPSEVNVNVQQPQQ
jgi:hypothetical protein